MERNLEIIPQQLISKEELDRAFDARFPKEMQVKLRGASWREGSDCGAWRTGVQYCGYAGKKRDRTDGAKSGSMCGTSMIRVLIDEIDLPIIVDAGIGKPSQACEAMEMGAAAIMANTAIATAGNVPEMAEAFRLAIEAGRS